MKIKIDNTLEQNIQDILDNNGTSLISTIILAAHPIGSIYMSVDNTNPGDIFGGTWVAWGTGRVPVGVNTDDTDFNAVEKTGGNKTHKHTISHTHGVPGVAHYHSLSDAGWAKMTIHGAGKLCYHELDIGAGNAYTSTYYIQGSSAGRETETDQWGAGLGGKTDSTTPGATTTNSQSTTNSGDGSTVQPYITCYMWKRTA